MSLVAATLVGVAIGSVAHFVSVDRAIRIDTNEVAVIGSESGSDSRSQGSDLEGSVDQASGSGLAREAGSIPGTHLGIEADKGTLDRHGRSLARPNPEQTHDTSLERLADFDRRFANTDWPDFDGEDLDVLFAAVRDETMSIRRSAMTKLQPYDGPRAGELGKIILAQIPREPAEPILRDMFGSKALHAVEEIPASLWGFVRNAESGVVQSYGVALLSRRNEPGSNELFREILRDRLAGRTARHLVPLWLDRTVVLGDDELIEDVSVLIENASDPIVRKNAIQALVRQLSATRAISALQDYLVEFSVADDLLDVLWRERNPRNRSAGSDVAGFFVRELGRCAGEVGRRRVLRVLAHFPGVCKVPAIRSRLQRIPASERDGENLFWWLACRSHTDVDESDLNTSARMRDALRSVLQGESDVAVERALAAVAASSPHGPHGIALFEQVECLGQEGEVSGTVVQVIRIRGLSRLRCPELRERSDARITAEWDHSDWWARLTATLMGLENRLPGARERLAEVIREVDCPVEDLRRRAKRRSIGFATDRLGGLRSGRLTLSNDDLEVLVSIVHTF